MAKIDLIISDLRQRIRGAGFQPGDMIPTQKELAREMGVSVVTMGQALRCLQEEGLLAATRGKGTIVKKPPIASDCTKVAYGLFVTPAHIHDPVIAKPIAALQSACEAAGADLRIFQLSASRITRQQLRNWAEGISAFFVLGTTTPEFVQSTKALGKPVIFFGEFYREPCPPWAGQITISVEVIALTCLQSLQGFGHENILLVRSRGTSYLESLGNAFDRSALHLGCADTLKQLTVPMDSDGSDVLNELRSRYPDVTALIVDGGMRASRIYHTLVKGGLCIPEDISLLAINGVDVSLLVTPHLSRVENTTFRLGEKLLSMATEMIEAGTVIREQMVPYMVWGKTCKNIRDLSEKTMEITGTLV